MPKIYINKKPELTGDKAFEIFKNKFGRKYDVYLSKLPAVDFVVKKSAWSGIGVKIFQKDDKTMIRFNAMAPSAFVRMLTMGLIPLLILYFTSWKKMQEEVKQFINQAPEFK